MSKKLFMNLGLGVLTGVAFVQFGKSVIEAVRERQVEQIEEIEVVEES